MSRDGSPWLPGLDDPPHPSRLAPLRPRTTREKGRRYERRKVCPACFKAFTPKGISRHLAACRVKATLTRPPGEA